MGVIYVIDSTDQANLEKSKQIFGSIMSNDLLMGKPFLILANKQDRPNAIDSLDICDFFEVEYLANLFQTPCLVEGVGRYQHSYDSEIVRDACSWLVKTICKNYKSIQNKIRFLRIVTQSESISSNEEIPRKNRRPATGKRKVSVMESSCTQFTILLVCLAFCFSLLKCYINFLALFLSTTSLTFFNFKHDSIFKTQTIFPFIHSDLVSISFCLHRKNCDSLKAAPKQHPLRN